jgi:hypothetical protein
MLHYVPFLIDRVRPAEDSICRLAAQWEQSRANNYRKIAADTEGGYLKLPTEFPGQTLVIRNEALLPLIKVNYDLLDFGRTRAAECGERRMKPGPIDSGFGSASPLDADWTKATVIRSIRHTEEALWAHSTAWVRIIKVEAPSGCA